MAIVGCFCFCGIMALLSFEKLLEEIDDCLEFLRINKSWVLNDCLGVLISVHESISHHELMVKLEDR